MYTYEEALKTSMEYFQGEELPAKVFVDKYALRDNLNNLLESNPDQMHRRLAKEFARIEAGKFKKPYTEDFIYNLFKNYSVIIPQGSPIMGIGNPYSYVTLSNCYVLTTPEDSYNSILMTDRELVNISKRRGGVGINLSNLRPAGSSTNNAARTSTGISSWMERYSNSIREVAQNGRRGALMLTLSVHHPDIETFITIKNDRTKVTGANISVMLTDEFLNAVKKNEDYEQRFPVDSDKPKISQKVSAKKLWDLIIKNAHTMAEPGLLFWDNIIKESPADCYKDNGFETKATNPCSEIPLSELDSCRLIAINLFSCVDNPFQKNAKYNYKLLYEYTQVAQRLMDDLIDLELECIDKILDKIKKDPEPEEIKREEFDLWYKIRQTCVIGRRTGLGITTLGDTIAALNIKYGSNESIGIVEEIYKTLKFGAYQSSIDISKEIGSFLCWDKNLEKDNLFINRFKEETVLLTEQKNPRDYIDALNGHEIWSDMKKYGRRNIALLTTAPTGTISTQASMKIGDKLYFNTTAGIEPLFKTHYIRRKKGNPGDKNFKSDFKDQNGDHWHEFEVYHSGVKAWMDVTGKDKIDKTCPYFGCTAEEINWVQRVKLQAAAQRHIDHAISSTINLPEDVSEEEVSKIYETAWKSGLKGITVYRANCRTGVLIEKKDTKRPKELPCNVHHVTVKNQQYLVLVGMMNDKPYETFACKNGILDKNIKAGKIIKVKNNFYKAVFDDETELSPITASCSEHEETISRLTSLALRTGTDYVNIIEQLNKVEGDMTSYAKCIGRVLKKYVKDGTTSFEDCPECKTKLIFNSGCTNCSNCGYSKCS